MIRILLIFLLSASFSLCRGQSYQDPKKADPFEIPAQNDIFLEVLGSGGGYSLNYERLILLGPPFTLRGRLGISFFASRFTFPALLQVSHTLKGPLALEWGGGVSLIPDIGEGRLNKEWTLLAGFRYSNIEGFLFRLSYTPFLRGGEDGLRIEHWGGVSAGLLF
jgi:hypothetical protein